MGKFYCVDLKHTPVERKPVVMFEPHVIFEGSEHYSCSQFQYEA